MAFRKNLFFITGKLRNLIFPKQLINQKLLCMRKNLLYSILLSGTVGAVTFTHAQNDRFAFAITDLQQTGAGWNALRKLDLNTGSFTQLLLNGTDANIKALDATSRK